MKPPPPPLPLPATAPPRSKQAPPSRPGLFDHLLVLAGAALSIHLMRLAPLTATPSRPLDPRVAEFFAFLPVLMRLPEGIILLWPLFFLPQWFRRSEGLTAGEWLWLLSWLGLLLLTGLTAWEVLLGLPEALVPHAAKPRLLWYMVVAPGLGALGLVVALVSLFRATPPPWTHWQAVALVAWPLLPVVLVLIGGEFARG